MSKIAAIHQPDFFPWLGFFDKMNKAQEYIVFDNVYITTGKSWSNRVKILLNKKEFWLTIPIKKKGISNKPISEVELHEPQRNVPKLLKTVKQAYLKYPYFDDVFTFIQGLNLEKEKLLSRLNSKFNIAIYQRIFNIKKDIYYASEKPELKIIDVYKTEMIIKVCKVFDVKEYISGEGCLSFLETDMFNKNNIKIYFQKFTHPIYSQLNNGGKFVPGLSVIDALMNIGFDGVRELLNNNL